MALLDDYDLLQRHIKNVFVTNDTSLVSEMVMSLETLILNPKVFFLLFTLSEVFNFTFAIIYGSPLHKKSISRRHKHFIACSNETSKYLHSFGSKVVKTAAELKFPVPI